MCRMWALKLACVPVCTCAHACVSVFLCLSVSVCVSARVCTCAHACMNAFMHALSIHPLVHAGAQTLPCTVVCGCGGMRVRVFVIVCEHMCAFACACEFLRPCMHACIPSYLHFTTSIYSCVHTHKYTHTHAHVHKHINVCLRAIVYVHGWMDVWCDV